MPTARSLDDLAGQLTRWRAQAGNPSYTAIVARIAEHRAALGMPAVAQRPGRVTVYDCFKRGRRRLDLDLVVEIGRALGLDDQQVAEWETVCWSVQHGVEASRVVSVRSALPTLAPRFVGRDAELGAIVTAGQTPVAVTGLAGSGKTQLAAHAAARMVDDGIVDEVVIADLRGFDAERPPAEPDALLVATIRALGGEPATIPPTPAARRHALSELLVARRALLILDDAANAEQVRPLLPPHPGPPIIVTSRVGLGRDIGAVELALGPLEFAAAAGLLLEAASDAGANPDRAGARRLARATGRLPLALAIIVARITARPAWSLADHADALIAQQGVLQIDGELRGAFDLSYASLPPEARRMLRLIAMQPCAELDPGSLAALCGGPAESIRWRADELVTASVAVRSSAGDTGLHDLIRTYAAAASYDEDRQTDRDEALGRLCDHLLETASAAVVALYGEATLPAEVAARAERAPRVDVGSARAWLDAQRENLLTISSPELRRIRPALTIDLSDALGRHFDRRGLHDDGLLLHERAVAVARQLFDRAAEGRAELFLGQQYVRLSQRPRAVDHIERGMRLLDEDSDAAALMSARNTLAIIAVMDGDLHGARQRFRDAADTARRLGDDARLASVLDNLAITDRRLGDLDAALRHHRMALDASERAGDREMVATGLTNVSELHLLMGDPNTALSTATAARAAARTSGFTPTEVYAITNMGCALTALGRGAEAVAHHRQALSLAEEVGRRDQVVTIRNNLGLSQLAGGELQGAVASFDRALSEAREIEDRFEEGRALDGLGRVAMRDGDRAAARRRWMRALAQLDGTGAPEAEAVRAALTALALDPDAAAAEDVELPGSTAG